MSTWTLPGPPLDASSYKRGTCSCEGRAKGETFCCNLETGHRNTMLTAPYTNPFEEVYQPKCGLLRVLTAEPLCFTSPLRQRARPLVCPSSNMSCHQ